MAAQGAFGTDFYIPSTSARVGYTLISHPVSASAHHIVIGIVKVSEFSLLRSP